MPAYDFRREFCTLLLCVWLYILCVLCCVQGVFEVCVERGLVLAEIGEGVSLEEVRAATGASFQV